VDGENIMANSKIWRGKKKYQHTNDFLIELCKLERLLDSLSQKNPTDKTISKCLGISRSILGKLGWKQKSLKRWQQVRPSKMEVGK
jgi:hypothetical protein